MTSLAQTILPHLPSLRRFARSLTGAQSSGDAYVAAVLQLLVADASVLPRDISIRAGLYQLMLRNWNAVSINQADQRGSLAGVTALSADRRLQAITPMPRQAMPRRQR